MIYKNICINKDLLLNLGFKMRYNITNESCFSKKSIIVYLYPEYITVLITLNDRYDHKLFKLDQLKELIHYVKESDSNK